MGSTKNVLRQYRALTNASMATDLASPTTDISWLDNVSVHIKIGAGATGEFFIQGSNVYDDTTRGPTTSDWVTIGPWLDAAGDVITLTTSGSAGSYLCNGAMFAFQFLRVIYTRTSGSGTVNVWICGKEV